MVTRLKACRPSTFLQRSHRIRSRTCYGSRTARAEEQLAHLFSTLEPSAASAPECCCKVKMDAPAAPACVVCLTSDLDSCTAKDRGRARIESSWSGAAVREDERCIRSRQYFRPIPLSVSAGIELDTPCGKSRFLSTDPGYVGVNNSP